MRTVGVYFFHIPKTAGMSVWHFLEQSFRPDEICPWWLWDQLITVPREQLGNWRIFRGHFLSHLEPYLCTSLATFTILRDPVDRTISHYCHVRRAPYHPFHDHARRMSLAEFCVHAETRHMVENYQAAYLAKSPQDPSAAAQGLSAEALARFELQEKLQYPDEFVAPRNLLEHAKARLAMFTAIGITADFGNSLTRISAALNCAAPQSCARRNVNPEPISVADLDRTTLALIRELTEIDQCLYEWVLSRLYAN